MLEINKIYCEDNIKTMNRMDDNFIDLTVTSPPYNVDLGNNKYNKNPYALYNDNKEYKEYLKWLEKIFGLLYLKTKSGGRCVINIGDGKNGRVPTHSDIIQLMNGIGWITYTIIIWNKNQSSSRTAWGSWLSASSPSFPTPFEYILVFCKNSYKLQYKGESDLEKEDFIKWSLALWSFAPDTRQKKIGHPAMFPVELPLRCIKLFSYKNAIVYDPFMGSGTTAIVSVKTGRSYIGSEITEEYVKISEERIINECNTKFDDK